MIAMVRWPTVNSRSACVSRPNAAVTSLGIRPAFS
jgi:hypothetical protein